MVQKMSAATGEFSLCEKPLAVAAPCAGVQAEGRDGSEARACVYARVFGECEDHV